MATAALHLSSTAHARPVIHVVKRLPAGGAVGLYVAGAGGEISRAGAVASLRRGKVENALLGGKPSGRPLIDLVQGGSGRGVYVTLPPPGERPNTKRYRVAVVAPGFRGILTSDSTRIDGLVSIPNITDTALALERGDKPPVRAVAGDEQDLRALDDRLWRIHRDRGWVLTAVACSVVVFGALAGAAAVVGALLLSWWGATQLWVLLVGIVALIAVLATLPRRRMVPWLVAAFFIGFLLVLVLAPETNALAALGPRPDGGGRFYGITNQVETLLLPPLLAGVVAGGLRWLVPLGALALVTVGWSKAGADGGGLVVFSVALAVLALRLRSAALTWRRVVLAGAVVVAVVAAAIGVDAVFGGSSHVTDAAGSGPGSLLGDLGHRLHLSWEILTKAPHNIVLTVISVAGLIWLAARRPRRAAVDAMLVAIPVSLLVNDTPVDVVGLGALGCLALLRFESVDSRPVRRAALTAACAVAVLTLAGCGDEGVVSPTPETVVGTVAQEAPGRAIFINQGCGSCHMYEPAGSDAQGTIGPDLDKLADYAKSAKQPLAQFTHESIVDPDAYIEKGYPKGVMPKSYKDLPESDLQALVDFLTKPQG